MAYIPPSHFIGSGGVNVYDPNEELLRRRMAASRVAAPAPAARSSKPVSNDKGPAVPIAQMRAMLGYDPMQPKQPEPAPTNDGGNPFGRGLGFIINNPVTQVALKPLQVLDYGRRAVTLGAEELSELLGGREFRTKIDPETGERTEFGDMSNWDKLKNPEYGVGQLLGDDTIANLIPGTSADQWANRIAGFVGDVALDPLSYVSFGTGAVAGKGARSSALAKLAEAQAAAVRSGDQALIKALGTSDDIARMGKRGVGIANAAQAEAMGIGRNGLRLGSPLGQTRMANPIPGTENIGRALNDVLGRARTPARNIPGARALRNTRNPIGFMGNDMGPALERIITGKGPGSLEGALATVALDDAAREVGEAWAGIAKQSLEKTVEGLKKRGFDTDTMTEAAMRAERGTANEWTQLGEEMRLIAKDLFDVDLPELSGDAAYVMPHVLNRRFRNDLMEAVRRGDVNARAFMKETGLREEDLLEDSGFVQRRSFRPNDDGTPKTLKIGDTEVLIERGTVEELNDKLAQIFPWYEGESIYETNPIIAYQRYISGMSKEVGKRGGGARVAATGTFRGSDTGIANKTRAPGRFDPYGGREDMFDADGNVIQRAVQQEGGLQEDEFWRAVPDDAATTARDKELRVTQKEVLDNLRTYSQGERAAIASDLEDLAEEIITPMRRARTEAVEAAGGQQRANRQVSEAFNTNRADAAALRTEADAATAEIGRLAKVRYGIERTARERTGRRQKELLDQLDARRRQLISQRDELEASYKQALKNAENVQTPSSVRAARKQVNERAREARENLNAARMKARREWEARYPNRKIPTDAQYRGAKEIVDGGRDAAPGRYIQEIDRAERRAQKTVSDYEAWKRYEDDATRQATTRSNEAARAQQEFEFSVKQMDATPVEQAATQAVPESEVSRLMSDQQKLNELNSKTIPALKKNLDKVSGEAAAEVAPLWRQIDALTKQATDEAATQDQINVAIFKMAEPKRIISEAALNSRQKIQAAKQALEAAQKEADDLSRSIAGRSNVGDSVVQVRRSRDLEKVEGAIAKAEKFLATPRARQLIADKNKLQALKRDAAKTPGRKGAPIRKQVRELEASIANRAKLSDQVEAAQASFRRSKEAQVELERAARPRPTGVEPTPQPDLQQALDTQQTVQGAQQAADRGYLPRIAQTEMELTGADAQFGRVAAGTDSEYNAIPLEEGVEAIGKRNAVNDQQERLRLERQVKNEEAVKLDDEAGGMISTYLEGLQNVQAMRDEHQRIAADIGKGGQTAANPARRTGELADKKPSGAGMDRAAANEVPPAIEQPLYSVVEDIRRLAQANPLGDDELLVRAEAALTPLERRLSKLTTEADIPARQTEQLLKAAKNGELAPVMMGKLRDDWTELWSAGDVVIGRELDVIYKNLKRIDTEPHKFFRVLTTYTNFFKTYATLTPGFHIRNGMSATFMNYAMGVPSTTQLEGLRVWRSFVGAPNPREWLLDAKRTTRERDAIMSTLASGAGGRYFEAGVADTTRLSTRMQERLFANRLTKASQRFGQDGIEGPVRTSLALHSLDGGADVRGTMQLIDRIHFDYSRVSEFDERAKRLIPFWTFMSRNLPMQLTTMWTKPRTYARYNSFVRNFKGEEVEGTPSYFENIGAFPLGDEKIAGLPLFLQPDFAHTRLDEDIKNIEDLVSGENILRPLTNVNPIFTAPLEFATGKDFFTGRQYDETDYRLAGPAEKPMEWLGQVLGQTRQTPNGQTAVKESFLNALRSLNPVYDRAVRLAPQVTTGGNETDAVSRQLESLARTMGFPIRTLSPQQQQSSLQAQRYDTMDQQAMQRALARLDQGA